MMLKNKLSQFKIKSFGFSLMEVMVAITIIGVIGVVSVAIFTQTLRTSSQTEGLSKLKQNGEQAMVALTETIRNAEAIVCYGPPDNTYTPPDNQRKNIIVVRTMEGKYVKLIFVDPFPSVGAITRNGYIAKQDNLNPGILQNPGLLSTFCDITHTSAEVALTNNDLTTGVSIGSGSFKKISGNVNKDTISVTFKVNPTKDRGANPQTENVTMQTTVQVR